MIALRWHSCGVRARCINREAEFAKACPRRTRHIHMGVAGLRGRGPFAFFELAPGICDRIGNEGWDRSSSRDARVPDRPPGDRRQEPHNRLSMIHGEA
jgi:hypothetical protein